ncbi:MAG: AAA family ATPase [Deltaproteobacteria bacterium]|nr:AAA family ATPase [Deltaproteobacteria bacterium]
MVKRTRSKAAKAEPSPPTYFLSLTLENYRSFGPKQTLDLSDGNGRPAPWTVILGDNGTGKTSLLRKLVDMVPRERPSHWPAHEPPVGRAVLLPFVVAGEEETPILHIGAFGASFLASYGYDALLKDSNQSFKTASLGYKHDGEFVKDAGATTAPIDKMVLFAYGANRPIGSGSLSEYHSDGTRSLTVENSPLMPAEEWLLQQDLLVRHGNGDANVAKQRLGTVIGLLKDLLPEDDIQDITFKAIELSSARQRIAVHVKTPYGEVQLRALSLGYRTLMAWMIDLAVQLFARYPDSRQPLHEPAVVLIDEIDLHLHPKWQRQLFEGLSAKFPNVQFIVTAHSPLVVQAAGADANIVVLQRPEGASYVEIACQPNQIRFWRLDQLLTSDLFGLPSARPPEFDKLYARKEALLGQAKLTAKEQAELAKIEARLRQEDHTESPAEARYLDILRRAAEEVAPKASVASKRPRKS